MLNTSCLEKLLTFFKTKFQNFQLITVHAKMSSLLYPCFQPTFVLVSHSCQSKYDHPSERFVVEISRVKNCL